MVIRIIDVDDEDSFRLVPPCADRSFDHRTCDHWEDAERGSRRHRPAWLSAQAPTTGGGGSRTDRADNPFAPPVREPPANPFDPRAIRQDPGRDPFGNDPEAFGPGALSAGLDLEDNPFAPRREQSVRPVAGLPRKLALLSRGRDVFGTYAKVLLVDDRPTAYAQFGPLSAYPRALRIRELYPLLPPAPLPAVITCIATTAEGRGGGHARRLVEAVVLDLAARGFAAVEAYPEVGADPDATSGASVAFWQASGFTVAAGDERFPVMRRQL